jgi:phosphoglycolate phosphatase-like HAD superfamily hydrolase
LGNAAAHQVIAVGDTEYDADAAGKINVRAIGLLRGDGNQEELNRVGCVAIYKHPADLLDHYEISPLQSLAVVH